MSIDKISSSTTMNFSTDYYQNKKQYDLNNSEAIIESSTSPITNVESQNQKETKENLQQVISSINKFLEPNNTSLKFELHEDLKEYYVTIVNNQTNEVVREIPSKKMLDIYAAMTEFLGFIVDKKI